MGYVAKVAANIRKVPGHLSMTGTVVDRLSVGQSVEIMDQQQYKDGLMWRLLKRPMHGWVAEKLSNGDQVIAPSNIPLLISPLSMLNITQRFGKNCKWYCGFSSQGTPLRGHNGVDYGIPMYSPIAVTDVGSVMWVGWDAGGYGHFVIVRHAWGESIYAHLAEPMVSVNQGVNRMEIIGRSGNSGNSTGPHLHFGIRVYPFRKDDGWGGHCNPIPFFS